MTIKISPDEENRMPGSDLIGVPGKLLGKCIKRLCLKVVLQEHPSSTIWAVSHFPGPGVASAIYSGTLEPKTHHLSCWTGRPLNSITRLSTVAFADDEQTSHLYM